MDSERLDLTAGIVPQPTEKSRIDSQAARLRRVEDYQNDALAKKNALEANLGSINAGMIRIAVWLDDILERTMGSELPSVELLQKISPAIDTQLRVARQIDRFANLELRVDETRKPKHNEDPVAEMCLGEPIVLPPNDQSEDSQI